MQVGFRQADRKFILDANTGQTLLYDLATDPTETRDLSASEPEAVAKARAELSQWVAWQTANRSMKAGKAEAPPATATVALAAEMPVIILTTGTYYQDPPAARLYLDGVAVGEFTVQHAMPTADAAVSDDQLQLSFADIAMTIPVSNCPRILEIEFLNDAWEGEGQTGDTDLLIKSVTVGAQSYGQFSFRPGTERVGGDFYGAFRMSRNGRMVVDLAISDSCLAAQIATP